MSKYLWHLTHALESYFPTLLLFFFSSKLGIANYKSWVLISRMSQIKHINKCLWNNNDTLLYIALILHFLLTMRYLAYIWHLDISIFQTLLALTNALQNEKRQNESQAKCRFERMLKDQRYKFEFLESEGEIISWTICFFQYKSMQLDLVQKQYWTFLQVTGYIE